MGIINDEELKVGEILHVTSLHPAEYIWGKFLGVLFCFFIILGLHILAMIFFNQYFPNAKSDEIRGPFALANYLRPAFFFALPLLIFLAGIAFAAGEWTRRPILVFVLPLVIFLACGFFLLGWEPTWLDPRIDQFLMLIDPTGFRWLSHTWLKVDRGVEFYNHQSVAFDVPFLLSRLALVFVGLVSVWLCQRHLTKNLRGPARPSAVGLLLGSGRRSMPDTALTKPGLRRLGDLRMRAHPQDSGEARFMWHRIARAALPARSLYLCADNSAANDRRQQCCRRRLRDSPPADFRHPGGRLDERALPYGLSLTALLHGGIAPARTAYPAGQHSLRDACALDRRFVRQVSGE